MSPRVLMFRKGVKRARTKLRSKADRLHRRTGIYVVASASHPGALLKGQNGDLYPGASQESRGI